MGEVQQKQNIVEALAAFQTSGTREAALRLFKTLGYSSERRIDLVPNDVEGFRATFDPHGQLNRDRALAQQWKSIDFLFQLTDEEIMQAGQGRLSFSKNPVDNTVIESYLFFAIHLMDANYSRTKLAAITREINRLVPMPAMILFLYGESLTLAIIDRRLSKRELGKDVLEKVTLIKDINYIEPLRPHIDILSDLSFEHLYSTERFHNWIGLHRAWQKHLDVQELNKKFYLDVAHWYFWAMQNEDVVYPKDVKTTEQKSLFFIRLITRLIFCWFLQEKKLIDRRFFRSDAPKIFLKDAISDRYYNAVLQNLFFATLNQEIEKRGFARDKGNGWYDQNRNIANLYRHADVLRDPTGFLALLSSVPFVNGGLFDCLDDKPKKKENREPQMLDGFSRNLKESTTLPDELFFGTERSIDLSEFYEMRKVVKVRGLIETFSRYKFTIEENTAFEEEVALDPELLGKVFENLLAAYNSDTLTTARNREGAFYTPREVVSFMVDETLIAHFTHQLSGEDSHATVEPKLRKIFEYELASFPNPLSAAESEALMVAIESIKILDPACGSGAFLMGALHRLVDVLAKLDPYNRRWKEQQLVRAKRDRQQAERDLQFEPHRRSLLPEMDAVIEDIEGSFNTQFHELDFARKLYLIDNSIFGVDKEPIACQIAKLRFFIALIVDQRVDPKEKNSGVRPLPNLETRIVTADSLVPIEQDNRFQLQLGAHQVEQLRRDLHIVRHDIFNARTPERKAKLRDQDASLRAKLALVLQQVGMPTKTARLLAAWDPYDQNKHASFFDPDWMFAVKEFDIVLGNPPYVRQEQIKDIKPTLKQYYDCYSGTADLYVYFYERSIRLLKIGGTFSFISSNKWFRSAYGRLLRSWVAANTRLLLLIDFGAANVFEAISYPCIIVLERTEPRKTATDPVEFEVKALNWDPEWKVAEIVKTVAANSFGLPQVSLSKDGWRLEGSMARRLLDRITAGGLAFQKYAIGQIYYGIKTGLNDAFVVDRSKRDELIELDPHSAAILKPFLRGRDIKRWRTEPQDLWIIFTRHGTQIDKYPAIYDHLNRFRKQLEPRPVNWDVKTQRMWPGRKPGRYEWFEIQDNVAYWRQFEQGKIIIPAITDSVNYAPDYQAFYSNDKTTIAIPPSIPFTLAILNSQVSWWFTRQTFASRQGGFFEFKPMYVSQVPIPQPPEPHKRLVEIVAQYLIRLNSSTMPRPELLATVAFYEQLLNGLVYELFFEAEMHTAKLFLFKYLNDAEPPDPSRISKTDQDAALRGFHHKISDLNHPIRSCLFSLPSLELVRIIEGEQ